MPPVARPLLEVPRLAIGLRAGGAHERDGDRATAEDGVEAADGGEGLGAEHWEAARHPFLVRPLLQDRHGDPPTVPGKDDRPLVGVEALVLDVLHVVDAERRARLRQILEGGGRPRLVDHLAEVGEEADDRQLLRLARAGRAGGQQIADDVGRRDEVGPEDPEGDHQAYGGR